MPRFYTALRRRHVVAAGLTCASLAGISAHAAGTADCVVQCGSQSCTVLDGGKSPLQLARGDRKHLLACAPSLMRGDKATLYGVFQSGEGLVRFTVGVPDKEFGSIVKTLAGATCALGDDCLEEREARRKAQPGGMGADEVNVVHQGAPCVMGLPCGVILKPRESLSFEVVGVTSGTFALTAKRGANKTASAYTVSNGQLTIPGAVLVPGGVYTYVLSTGAKEARGEFSVQSARIQSDIESSIADLRRTEPDSAGVGEIEILMSEDLRWDATQRLH